MTQFKAKAQEVLFGLRGSALRGYVELGHDEPVVSAIATALAEAAAAEREACAKIADDEGGNFWYAGEHRNMVMLQGCCREIATAIRARGNSIASELSQPRTESE